MPSMTTGSTLAELMDNRRLSMQEVLLWAPATAAAIDALHQQGRSHGDISAANIRIQGNSAVLIGGAKESSTSNQPRDIAQFAAVLSGMLERAAVESEDERERWLVLDRIASTNSNATEGSRMKKVAAALKLVRPRCRVGVAVAAERSAPVGRVEDQDEKLRSKRVLMLVREVPPEPSPALPRVHANAWRIWAYFATAAGIAVTACILYLKLAR